VAQHWPQFGQHGKESITILQRLRHRSGLPVARSPARDALAMTDGFKPSANPMVGARQGLQHRQGHRHPES
jgi:CubicO group peptidase (beta-lactamase class C family)